MVRILLVEVYEKGQEIYHCFHVKRQGVACYGCKKNNKIIGLVFYSYIYLKVSAFTLQTEKCIFHTRFSDRTSKIHTHFQTWPLGRNYVISLLRLERKKSLQMRLECAYFYFVLIHLDFK